MWEYPWNEANITFIWLNSLYNPFKENNLRKRVVQWVKVFGIKKLPAQTPLGAQSDLGIQSQYKAPDNLLVEKKQNIHFGSMRLFPLAVAQVNHKAEK